MIIINELGIPITTRIEDMIFKMREIPLEQRKILCVNPKNNLEPSINLLNKYRDLMDIHNKYKKITLYNDGKRILIYENK